jgi:hypothetical protein
MELSGGGFACERWGKVELASNAEVQDHGYI